MRRPQPFLQAIRHHVAGPLQTLAHDELARVQTRRDLRAGPLIPVEEVQGLSDVLPQLLAAGAATVDGIEIVRPVQANAVFARLQPRHIAALQQDWTFHVWDEDESMVRWMTAFDTTEADVDAFLSDIKSTAG